MVDRASGGRVLCSMPGKFRAQGIRPIVGDVVEYSLSSAGQGRIEAILPRKSELPRPRISNIEQIILVLSLREPEVPTHNRSFPGHVEHFRNPVRGVVNKIDLSKERAFEVHGNLWRILRDNPGSSKKKINIERMREALKGKISAMAGMSGVARAAFLNTLKIRGLQLRVPDLPGTRERDGILQPTPSSSSRFRRTIADTPALPPSIASIEVEDLQKSLPNWRRRGECAPFRLRPYRRAGLLCKRTAGSGGYIRKQVRQLL